MFWPTAHDDIIGLAFRPSAYADSFWASAYDEVFDDIFWPPAHTDGDTRRNAAREGPNGRSESAASRLAALSRELVQTCDGRSTGAAASPFERLERSLHPTGRQRPAMDDLRAASARAIKVLDAACPPDAPHTPVARLDVMENRLTAALRAIEILSPPIEAFYDTLSAEQKARFDLPGTLATAKGARDVAGSGPAGGTCDGEQVPRFAELTIRHVEQVVRPTEAQRAALGDLNAAASRVTATLRAACPTDPAATPKARLAAMRQRIGAMLEAVQTMRPALKTFYALLTDEQKARFNAMSARTTDVP